MPSQEKPDAVKAVDPTSNAQAQAPRPEGPGTAPSKETEFALLLQQHGEIPAGRIVRGTSSEIRALGSGIARPATAQERGIAGGKSIRLPKKR